MNEKCIPCEAAGRDTPAVTQIEFEGELIPCCSYCKDIIESGLLFIDEESEEQGDY